MYGPGCAEPTADIDYQLGSPLSHVATRTNETCDSGSTTAVTAPYMEAFAWVDGMGRARGAVSEGSTTDGFEWILSGVQEFDAKGAVQRAYLLCPTDSVPSTTARPLCRSTARPLYARSSYDAFGRVVRAWTTDGTAVVATRHGALATDIRDAGDLSPGAPCSGTPATTYVDGLGRTVRTVERNRSAGSAAMETFATDLQHNALGAVVQMQRGLVSGSARDSAFVANESVLKLQTYDTFGRRIVNSDPDAGTFRYKDDALGRRIATMDGRQIVNRYGYDRGGRLVAEDFGGDVDYDADGWEEAGGPAARTCPLGTNNLPTTIPAEGCFDVLYGFDHVGPAWSEPWMTALPPSTVSCGGVPGTPQGPLAGRPS